MGEASILAKRCEGDRDETPERGVKAEVATAGAARPEPGCPARPGPRAHRYLETISTEVMKAVSCCREKGGSQQQETT